MTCFGLILLHPQWSNNAVEKSGSNPINILGIYVQVALRPVFVSPGQLLALQASTRPGGPSACCSPLTFTLRHEAAALPMKEKALVAETSVGSPPHPSGSRVQVHTRQHKHSVRLKLTFSAGWTGGVLPRLGEHFIPIVGASRGPAATAALHISCGSGLWVQSFMWGLGRPVFGRRVSNGQSLTSLIESESRVTNTHNRPSLYFLITPQ